MPLWWAALFSFSSPFCRKLGGWGPVWLLLVNWSRSVVVILSLFTLLAVWLVRLEGAPNESGVPAGSELLRLGSRFCLRLETLSKMLPLLLCVLF